VKIPETEHPDVRRLFEVGLMSCSKIAQRYGCSRQHVYNVLERLGVDTAKKMQTTSCKICGAPVERTRGQMRRHFHNYCSPECWAIEVGSPEYQERRQADRVAREVVRGVYSLKPENVVLHLDGNHWNRALENLYVVRTLEEKLMFERGVISVEAFGVLERRWVWLKGEEAR